MEPLWRLVAVLVLLAFLLALGSLAIHEASPMHQAILMSKPAHTKRNCSCLSMPKLRPQGKLVSQGGTTLPSLNVDLDPGGYLEDLGLILGILAIMVSSI